MAPSKISKAVVSALLESDEEEDDSKDVFWPDKNYLPMGSVSRGTMNEADLVPVMIDLLAQADPRMAELMQDEYEEIKEARATDLLAEFCWEYLVNKLDQHTPPYTYFGPHPGDGSDYGVWPASDWIDETLEEHPEKLTVIRPGEPTNFTSTYAVVADESGFYTALLTSGGETVWKYAD